MQRVTIRKPVEASSVTSGGVDWNDRAPLAAGAYELVDLTSDERGSVLFLMVDGREVAIDVSYLDDGYLTIDA